MKKIIALGLTASLLALTLASAGCSANRETKADMSEISVTGQNSTKEARQDEDSKKESTQSDDSSTALSSASVAESSVPTESSTEEPSENSVEESSSVSEPSLSSDVSAVVSSEPPSEVSYVKLTASPEIKEKYSRTEVEKNENGVNIDYPGITQKQFDEIVALRCEHFGDKMLYQEGIILGTVDQSAPRLTLSKMKEIINKAKDQELEADKDVWRKYKKYPYDYSNCYAGYIINEFKKIQIYDCVETHDPTGCLYYLSVDENGKPIVNENEIPVEYVSIMDVGMSTSIIHYALNNDGELSEEKLYMS